MTRYRIVEKINKNMIGGRPHYIIQYKRFLLWRCYCYGFDGLTFTEPKTYTSIDDAKDDLVKLLKKDDIKEKSRTVYEI